MSLKFTSAFNVIESITKLAENTAARGPAVLTTRSRANTKPFYRYENPNKIACSQAEPEGRT